MLNIHYLQKQFSNTSTVFISEEKLDDELDPLQLLPLSEEESRTFVGCLNPRMNLVLSDPIVSRHIEQSKGVSQILVFLVLIFNYGELGLL